MTTGGRAAWIAGFVVGVGAGVLSLVIPTVGWVIAGAFAVPAIISRARVAAIGGLLAGFGSAWLGLLARATLDCQAFDAAPGQECVSPDLAPWLIAGSVMLAVGIGLSAVAVVRARRTR